MNEAIQFLTYSDVQPAHKAVVEAKSNLFISGTHPLKMPG